MCWNDQSQAENRLYFCPLNCQKLWPRHYNHCWKCYKDVPKPTEKNNCSKSCPKHPTNLFVKESRGWSEMKQCRNYGLNLVLEMIKVRVFTDGKSRTTHQTYYEISTKWVELRPKTEDKSRKYLQPTTKVVTRKLRLCTSDTAEEKTAKNLLKKCAIGTQQICSNPSFAGQI